VVHAAAHVGGRVDIDGRPLYLAGYNLSLDGALFEWATRTRPGAIVYFSSSAAYPTHLQERQRARRGYRLREADIVVARPDPGDASYGMVKLVGERMAAMANDAGIPTYVFRPFSGYGPGQSLAYPFPSFADRALWRTDPFQVWSDGTATRDFIHIGDVTAAVLACLDEDVRGPINLCTGRGVSFNELAAMFLAAADYSPTIEHVLDAPRGVTYRVGDPARLHEIYVPKTSLEQGVTEALG
jgi:nucleoside-diphosphate-sugar epimerase